MTFLVAVWTCSLLSLLGVVAFAFYRMARGAQQLVHASHDLDEFVREEFTHLFTLLSQTVASVKPHTKRFGLRAALYGKRGRDIFGEHVFGRMQSERGSAASFFLKYIAEHKEAVRKETQGRVGY